MSARICLVILLAAFITGCKSGASADSSSPAVDSFDFSLYVRDATSAETYYVVARNGSLSFGGGLDARFERTTWTGTLLPDEARRLRELLEARNWFEDKPQSTKQPPEVIYRVALHSKQNSRSFQLKGEHPDIQPFFELLDTASLRRLEVDLRRLPQPSIQQK